MRREDFLFPGDSSGTRCGLGLGGGVAGTALVWKVDIGREIVLGSAWETDVSAKPEDCLL